MAQIGIKLADHTFYPVLTDDEPQKKRMVLTVARDGQQSVQVDLIRRSEEGDEFVGSLVLDDLPEEAGRELEFQLSLDSSGAVEATIRDGSGDHHQSFSTHLSGSGQSGDFQLPDESSAVSDVRLEAFESDEDDFTDDFDFFEGEEALHDAVAERRDTIGDDELIGFDDEEESEEARTVGRPFNIVVLIAAILIVLSIVMVGAYFVFVALRGDALPELRSTAAAFGMADTFRT